MTLRMNPELSLRTAVKQGTFRKQKTKTTGAPRCCFLSPARAKVWTRENDQMQTEIQDFLNNPERTFTATTSPRCPAPKKPPLHCHVAPAFYHLPRQPMPMHLSKRALRRWKVKSLAPITPLGKRKLPRSAKTMHLREQYPLDLRSKSAYSLSSAVICIDSYITTPISKEMNETVAAHIQKYGNGNHLWENEITSLLAQPLDASVYTSRELQLSQEGIAPAFQSGVSFPYSNLAHEASGKINKKCRRHFHIRTSCALELQRIFRGYTSRLLSKTMKNSYCNAVARIERFCISIAPIFVSRNTSARVLQRTVRCYAQRKAKRLRRQKLQAIFFIAHAFRKKVVFYIATKRHGTCWRVLQRLCHSWVRARKRGRAASLIQGFSKILVSREIVQHVKEAVLLSEKKRLISENEYIKAAEESAVNAAKESFTTIEGENRLAAEIKRIKTSSKQGAKKGHRKLVNEKETIRCTFELFDVDGSGTIDIDELRQLMKILCIPISETNLERGFEDMDANSSGCIDFDEFYNWSSKDSTTSDGEDAAQWKLMKVKLRGQKWISDMTGHTNKMQATRNVLSVDRIQAHAKALVSFRIQNPPRHICVKCSLSFPFLSTLTKHHIKCCQEKVFDLRTILHEQQSWTFK